MALPTSLKLFIDTINGVAYPSFTSNSAITNPVFYAGDKAKLEIYLIQPTDNPNYPKAELPYDAGLTIKAAVGNIDADPTGGTWKIGYGSDTTGELNYNATASSLSSALNGLASITADGGVAVSSNAGNYIITFNTVGSKQLLTTNPSKLTPISAATIIELQAGDSTHSAIYAIHLQQTVVAYTNTFTPVSAAAASVSELAAWNGSTVTYRLVLNPDPKDGTFILNYNSAGDVSSSSTAIPVDASSLEIQNGLARGELDNKVLVNQVGAYSWDLTISLEPDAGLTADSSGIISYTGWIGELNFNTAHVIGLLNSAESVEAHLEVEITAATKPLTVLQLGCTIRASVIDEAAVEPLVLDTYLTLSQADSNYLKLTNPNNGEGATVSGNVEFTGGINTFSGYTQFSGAAAGVLFDDVDVYANGRGMKFNNGDGLINISGSGITFGDSSVQVTAALPLTGGTVTGMITAKAGIALQNDSSVYDDSYIGSDKIEWGASIFNVYPDTGVTFNVHPIKTVEGIAGNVTFKPDDMVQTITVLEGSVEIKPDAGTPVTTDGIKLNNNGRQIEIASAGDAMFASHSAYGMTVAQNGNTSIIISGDGSNFVNVYGATNVADYTEHNATGIKINTAAVGEVVELSTWGLGISDTDNGTGGNVAQVTPTGIALTSVENLAGDAFSSSLTSSQLKLGVVSSSEPEVYTLITPTFIRFSDGSTQVSAFTSNTYAPLASPTFTGDPKAPTPLLSDNDTSIATTAYVQGQGYAKLTGATYTGKLNLNTGTSNVPLNLGITGTPSVYTNGDVWISGLDLRFRDSAGATKITASLSNSNSFSTYQSITANNASIPALTVIQNGNGGGVLVQNPTGTGYSFKVEDSTAPDTTPFTVDASGKVGIGITPDATAALAIDSSGIKFNGSTAQTVPFLPPLSDGNYYVYRNGAWLAATVFTQGGKNYLTV